MILSRKRHIAHSGASEGTGLTLCLRWFLRKRSSHGKRLPVLVDARAFIGVAAKGRTSARSISLDLKRIAVVTFSIDLLPSYVYVPSEDNPADAPSRNVRTKKFGKRGQRPVIAKFGARTKCRKERVSSTAKGLPWWRSTDDVVGDFLDNVCTDDNRQRYQGLFRSFESS